MALRFLFFFSVMSLLVVSGHVYLYRRLVRDVTSSRRLRVFAKVTLWVLGLSVVAGRFLARVWPSGVALFIGDVSFVWMGVALALLLTLLTLDSVRGVAWLVRTLHRKARRSGPADPGPPQPVNPERRRVLSRALAGSAWAIGGGFSAYGAWRAYHEPVISEVAVRLPGLPRTLDGFSIVQLTDIHVGNMVERRFMEALVQRTNALSPDLVAVTGDLVDGNVAALGEAVSMLGRLRSRAGTFFVTGNHEYYSGDKEWVAFLEKLGIQVLRNRHVRIGDKGGSFDLAGVDDWAGSRSAGHGEYDLSRALHGRNRDTPAVLLAHQPANFPEAVRQGVGLQISGHTHGGQLFPFTHVVDMVWTYAAGHYRHEDAHIYVSRGCGFWGPPMRVGSPPEIVKLVLTA